MSAQAGIERDIGGLLNSPRLGVAGDTRRVSTDQARSKQYTEPAPAPPSGGSGGRRLGPLSW